MGCTKSVERKLVNEDVDIKRKFLVGIHFSKGGEGFEGNVQIALGTTRKKKYEMVSTEQTVEEDVQGESVQEI